MAGSTYTINFDTGIEKVEYAQSLDDFPSGELTSSGQTVGGTVELYVRPIFKQGYELDSTNVVLTDTNGIYGCRKKNYVVITNVTFTSKQSTPTLTFKHFYDAGTIGSGTYKFRHYSQQEPSSSETWVLNDVVDTTSADFFTINFISNGIECSRIDLMYARDIQWIDFVHGSVGTTVYRNGTWTDEAYRTITFATTPTGDLLTWLQANGTKQGGGGQ